MSIAHNILPIFEVITHEEFDQLRRVRFGNRPHPLSSLLGDLHHPSQIAANTGIAVRRVLDNDPTWINNIKKRILDKTDSANAASALAEIRAYGALLEAGFTPRPGVGKRKPKPEFLMDWHGRQVVIEVHAKQIHGDMQAEQDEHASRTRAQLEEFKDALVDKGKRSGVFTGEPLEIAPLGKPDPNKQDDTLKANAISRLCAIKAGEHQLRDGAVNILWFDLQDDYSWQLGLDDRDALPYSSFEGIVTSGALWFALYGWKGAPIFEPGDPYMDPQRITPMGHDGRFSTSVKLSAVIATFPKSVVLLENPSTAIPLDNLLRRALMHLPWARAEFSLCEWEPGLLSASIEIQRRAIAALKFALVEEWSESITIGILAYGSLIGDSGEEIASHTTETKRNHLTPFGIEFARTSTSRGGAPTLVPVDEGHPAAASIYIVSMNEKEATDALYRREIHEVGGSKTYDPTMSQSKGRVRIERIENFAGVDVVLYAALPSNVEPLTAENLATLAITSVAKASLGKDGISYLIDARRNGIETALSNDYANEILRQTDTASLEEALEKARSAARR